MKLVPANFLSMSAFIRNSTKSLPLVCQVTFILLVAFAFYAVTPIQGQTSPATRTHPAISGDLVELLKFVGQTFDTSVLAEISQPFPTGLRIPDGQDTADEVMDLLVQQSAGYAWQRHGNVMWIYNPDVTRSSGDFLNLRRKFARLPDSLARLRLHLPMEVSVAEGKGGGVVTGIASKELEESKLTPMTLNDVSIRDVLFQAADQVKLLCLFIFPNSNPTPADQDETFSNWYLIPNKSLMEPLGARSVPAKHNFGSGRER